LEQKIMWHSLLADPASTFWLPIRASTAAADNDWLFNFILWVNIFFSVLIIALMVLFVWRYKAKSVGDAGARGGAHPGRRRVVAQILRRALTGPHFELRRRDE